MHLGCSINFQVLFSPSKEGYRYWQATPLLEGEVVRSEATQKVSAASRYTFRACLLSRGCLIVMESVQAASRHPASCKVVSTEGGLSWHITLERATFSQLVVTRCKTYSLAARCLQDQHLLTKPSDAKCRPVPSMVTTEVVQNWLLSRCEVRDRTPENSPIC